MQLTKEMCEHEFSKTDLITQRFVCAVLLELKTAKAKHPNWPVERNINVKYVASLTDKAIADFVTAAAIVSEESGELIRAALQFHYEDGQYYAMHKEAIQTAAMALRFLVESPELE